MTKSSRLTDILLEPVSSLMGLFADGVEFDASVRRREAQALLASTRRLLTTGVNAGHINVTLITAPRGSVVFALPAGSNTHRRGVRPTEAFSELAYTA